VAITTFLIENLSRRFENNGEAHKAKIMDCLKIKMALPMSEETAMEFMEHIKKFG